MSPNKNKKHMLPTKNKSFFSELQNFFVSDDMAGSTILSILNRMHLPLGAIPRLGSSRVRYSRRDLVCLLILFPLVQIRNIRNYVSSPVSILYGSGKDTFYRLMKDHEINWRTIVYSVTQSLFSKSEKRAGSNSEAVRCLILDDTDLPKRGKKLEFIGRVWSHVQNRSILGFKGLFLGYHDGKSFFGLDFSLHGEKGKNKKFPFGMKEEALMRRFTKDRSQLSPSFKRIQEYFMTKNEVAIELVTRAIKRGIRFDYLLVDSWFLNERLVRFVMSRKIGCHLLGMVKMGNTLYHCNGKLQTASQIINKLRVSKGVRRSRALRVSYAIQAVEFKGKPAKLFFCRCSSHGKWNAVLSTNTRLNFEEAYRIYSTRWSIEVFFKDCKQNLGLGKNQSLDFDSQIASISLVILQFNILSMVKKFSDYETIGGLFREFQKDALMITVADRLWLALVEILTLVADTFNIEIEDILCKLIDDHPLFRMLLKSNELDLVAG